MTKTKTTVYEEHRCYSAEPTLHFLHEERADFEGSMWKETDLSAMVADVSGNATDTIYASFGFWILRSVLLSVLFLSYCGLPKKYLHRQL